MEAGAWALPAECWTTRIDELMNTGFSWRGLASIYVYKVESHLPLSASGFLIMHTLTYEHEYTHAWIPHTPEEKRNIGYFFLFHYGQFLAQVKGFQLDTVENELM